MPRTKAVTDDEVLDLALVVLLEQGPHRFTLPDVGQAVGLSPSTLIQRFGSKRVLLERVLARATVRLEESLQESPSTGDPHRDLIDWMIRLAGPFRTRAHVAANLTLLIEDLTDEPRRRATMHHMSVVRAGIARHLHAMTDRATDVYVDMVEAHWHGLVMQWALHGEGEIEAWIAPRLAALLDVLGLRESDRARCRGRRPGDA